MPLAYLFRLEALDENASPIYFIIYKNASCLIKESNFLVKYTSDLTLKTQWLLHVPFATEALYFTQNIFLISNGFHSKQ
jgi:hypothetical protein